MTMVQLIHFSLFEICYHNDDGVNESLPAVIIIIITHYYYFKTTSLWVTVFATVSSVFLCIEFSHHVTHVAFILYKFIALLMNSFV